MIYNSKDFSYIDVILVNYHSSTRISIELRVPYRLQILHNISWKCCVRFIIKIVDKIIIISGNHINPYRMTKRTNQIF